jgi:DNA repair protein RadC
MELKLLEIKRATGREVESSQDVYEMMAAESKVDRECLWVLHLNHHNFLVEKEIVSMGTLTATLAGPREVFRRAVINSSKSIICVHNHPTGNPSPSQEDYKTFDQLTEAGDLLNIRLLDFIILGKDNYFSFRRHNARKSLQKEQETSSQIELFSAQEVTCVECGEWIKPEKIVYVGREIYCPYCWEVCFGKRSED